MKIEVDRERLVDALSKVRGVAAKDAGMPVLRSILLRTDGERQVEITATNLEMSLRLTMEARVLDPGAVTLPAKEALAISRNFAESLVTIEVDSREVVVSAGRSRRRLPTIDMEDYPSIQPFDADFHQIDKPAFIRAIAKIFYAVPAENDAFGIAGAYLHRSSDGFRLVASDGHRAAYCDIRGAALAGGVMSELLDGVIIPYPALNEITRAMEREGDAWIAIEDDRIVLKTSDAILSSQLLEAEYPEYQMIFPEKRPFSMTLDSEEFSRRLKSMSVLSSAKFQAVRLDITDGNLKLTFRNEANMEAVEEMAVGYTGEPFTVYIAMRYLLGTLSSMSGGDMVMEWVNGNGPCVFTEPANRDAVHLIMPMVM